MTRLRVFSKNDVKYTPYKYSLEERIVNLAALLQIDFSQTLLVCQGYPFIVTIGRAKNISKKDDVFYSERLAGSFNELEWLFLDKDSGKLDCIKYGIIELDSKLIDHCIMDVVFFHELREMYYQKILSQFAKVSHSKAKEDEKNYVERFLSLEEKQIYEQFSKRRSIIRRVRGKIISA